MVFIDRLSDLAYIVGVILYCRVTVKPYHTITIIRFKQSIN